MYNCGCVQKWVGVNVFSVSGGRGVGGGGGLHVFPGCVCVCVCEGEGGDSNDVQMNFWEWKDLIMHYIF